MIDGKNFFYKPISKDDDDDDHDFETYENIRKVATGKGDDYTTGCLLDYPYFKENYRMIIIDLHRQQAFDADPRAIQQINITANLGRVRNTTMFLIYEKAKKCFGLFTRNCKSFVNVLLNDLIFVKIKWRNTIV